MGLPLGEKWALGRQMAPADEREISCVGLRPGLQDGAHMLVWGDSNYFRLCPIHGTSNPGFTRFRRYCFLITHI